LEKYKTSSQAKLTTDFKEQTAAGFEKNLDFVLSHFEEPIWPRTISTHTTEGRQILVYSKEEALARYKQASLLDCRINAYPDYTEYGGINRQAPNFLFLDLDRSVFESEKAFNAAFNKTLGNLSDILGCCIIQLFSPLIVEPPQKELNSMKIMIPRSNPLLIRIVFCTFYLCI
jgi:hypothetical protein